MENKIKGRILDDKVYLEKCKLTDKIIQISELKIYENNEKKMW